jgi:hypothetical protein
MGSTETKRVRVELLSDLVDRGLDCDQGTFSSTGEDAWSTSTGADHTGSESAVATPLTTVVTVTATIRVPERSSCEVHAVAAVGHCNVVTDVL